MTSNAWLLPLILAGACYGQKVPTGPDVGAMAPDFSAPDQTGQVRTLRSILGPKGAMLVFYRSADW